MNTQGVVLFGIAMVFSFNALVSLVQFVASAEALQNLVFWTMGSLSRSSWASAARWPWHWPCRWPCVSPGS